MLIELSADAMAQSLLIVQLVGGALLSIVEVDNEFFLSSSGLMPEILAKIKD